MMDRMTGDSVHILVLPVFGQTLVVPVALIEEVLPVRKIAKTDDLPGVFAGQIDWRGKRIGVTSVNALAGGAFETPEPHNRMVVFKPLAGCDGGEYFALLIDSDPEPRAVGRMDLQKDVNAPADNPLVISHCTLDGRGVGIPDMDEWRKRICPDV